MNKEIAVIKQLVSVALLAFLALVLNSCDDDEKARPAPTIVSFTPANGGAGTEVVITGTDFSSIPAENTVVFGTLSAEVTKASATELTVTAPAEVVTGKISITVGGQTTISENEFIVIASTKTLGESGGALTGVDGKVSIKVPTGAIPDNTEVSIVVTEDVAPNGIGKIYTLTPEGTQFAEPVTLSFQYTDADALATPPSRMAIGYKKSDGKWQVMPTLKIDEATKTITTETLHFSQWSLLEVEPSLTFAPASGPVGIFLTATVTGVPLSLIVADNLVKVNGVAATVMTVTTTSTVGILTFAVPAGASSGPVQLEVNGQTVVSATDFTVFNRGINLLGNHIGYEDIQGNLQYLMWTYTAGSAGVKIDTALVINSVAGDPTFSIRLPYKARLYGYTPADGYSASMCQFTFSSKNEVTYILDTNALNTNSNSVHLSETVSGNYLIGTFSFPVIGTYVDEVTGFNMTEFETLSGSYRLPKP
jgi:hypothetical protein